jgi:hypothetical protein
MTFVESLAHLLNEWSWDVKTNTSSEVLAERINAGLESQIVETPPEEDPGDEVDTPIGDPPGPINP